MPWRYPDNVPSVAENWTADEQRRCVAAANAVLRETRDDEQAIYACIHAAGKEAPAKEGGKRKESPMEHKTFPALTLKADADQGIVEQIVAVFGNLDMGADVIHNGAFAKSIAERGTKIRVLDQHNTDSIMRVIGKPLSVREIGRDELPAKLVQKFPEATGGMFTRTQYLMETPEGKGAFLRIKAGAIDEASIGYDAIDVDFSKATRDGQQITVRNLRTCRLWEYSPVIWGMNPATTTLSAKSGDPGQVKGVIPFKATEKAPEGEAWSRPTLQDFTDKSWGDLSDGEKRGIASHFAWSDNMPPETYGDLKLPHHRPSDGAVVWTGVANCMARMNQAEGIDQAAVRGHLRGHYRQFDKPFPGEDGDKTDGQPSETGDSEPYLLVKAIWEARLAEFKEGQRLNREIRKGLRQMRRMLEAMLAGYEDEEDQEPTKPQKADNPPVTSSPEQEPEEQAGDDTEPERKAGPGTQPPTLSESATDGAGPDVTPPTSSEAPDQGGESPTGSELDAIQRELKSLEALLAESASTT